MATEYRPIARSSNLVTQEVENELLVFNPATGQALRLNQTAAGVWRACDGTQTVAQIASDVEAQIGQLVSEDVVWLALQMLEKEGLVGAGERPLGDVLGEKKITRRQVAMRLGAAGLLVLPFVGSLTVPTSAQVGTVPALCLQCLNLPQGDATGCGVCANINGNCVNGNSCNAGGTPVVTTCTACASQVFGGGGSNNAWTAA